MPEPLQNSASKSRFTKQRIIDDQLNAELVKYLSNVAEEIDAETLWLAMRAQGNTLSQSTCNNRLKKLVEAGLIEKRSSAYNRHRYLAVSKSL